jgi:hypothetical protein
VVEGLLATLIGERVDNFYSYFSPTKSQMRIVVFDLQTETFTLDLPAIDYQLVR